MECHEVVSIFLYIGLCLKYALMHLMYKPCWQANENCFAREMLNCVLVVAQKCFVEIKFMNMQRKFVLFYLNNDCKIEVSSE